MGIRIALVVSAVVLGGCAAWRPPVHVFEEYQGPIRSRDVGQGRETFVTLCAACHRGRVNPQGLHWTPAHMRHQIREGNALMPALREQRLSDARVEAVLAYLSTVGAIDGTLPPHPDEWAENDGWEDDAARGPTRLLDPPERSDAPLALAPAATEPDSAMALPFPAASRARALGRP